jgi:hypothetical protein
MMTHRLTVGVAGVLMAVLIGQVRADDEPMFRHDVGRSAAEQARLAAEAKALAEAAQKRYGPGYTTKIDDQRHIVYVSALDAYTFSRAVGMLETFSDQQRQMLFREPLPWNVTVILPTLSDYRKPQATASFEGHYERATRTLESLSLSDVLYHEFTHALHHADEVQGNQRHPVWIREGLACLLQQWVMREGKLEVLPGRDLAVLQEAVRNRKVHPFAALFAMDQEAFFRDADLCYAESHYIMFYLHQFGKLKDFYETYKAGYAAGGASLAKTLGKPLDKIETDWREWVLRQPAPWTPAQMAKPLLGIKMEAVPEGVRITGFVRGSAAERAGQLKFGDIVLSVAGQGTPTPRDLTAAVQACEPGQTVDIEVIRDGRTTVVKQLLSATSP